MFRSNTGSDDGIEDPDRVEVQELEDKETGDRWITIIWHGRDYDEGWIQGMKDDFESLKDKE